MSYKPILIVAGEPNSIFLEIFIKSLKLNKFHSPLVLICSKKLLIKQIENPVRWRESIINMIDNGVKSFIEIGPGKVLSGLVKRIDRNVKLNQVNNLIDIKNITND